MWHVLHLIARLIEILLGVFCVSTAILLYPSEEGNLQSKFEDFWIRVDDFQKWALSKHAAFMTGVAKLESRFLDWVFGPKLISEQASIVSFAWSIFSFATVGFVYDHSSDIRRFLSKFVICAFVLCITNIFIRRHGLVRRILTAAGFIYLVFSVFHCGCSPSDSSKFFLVLLSAILMGFGCDLFFIAATRKLLRWAAQMVSWVGVSLTVLLNLVLAVALVLPIPAVRLVPHPSFEMKEFLFIPIIAGASNILDSALASLFVLLALLLLVHRAVWPLLTRTLFRMADIGTKGRRAILTTVGLALVAAGVTGKVPELVQKVIEKL
jgi:hypothetical protein